MQHAFTGKRGHPVAQDARITGLILSGGGARAAYQVGVLMALADLVPRGTRNPFPVICGTSAGAINAAALSANAHNYRMAVRGLERVWANITPEQVYRTDFWTFLKSIIKWSLSGVLTGDTPVHSALLDSEPLEKLLNLVINFPRIQQAIEAGDLRALSITASSYATGESVAFFQGQENLEEWTRARRLGRKTRINAAHLLGSSAIPILFPAARVHDRYYGDGAVRQLAPVSPALHLGAERVLVVGVSGNAAHGRQREISGYPSLAQVLGHILNSVFVDTLEADVERLERINNTLHAIPASTRRKQGIALREVDVLKIYPSEPIDEIASRYIDRLPRTLRFFLRGSGATRSPGASAVSYLLFEPGFCRTLMSLGYRDAMAREQEIRDFLELPSSSAVPVARSAS
ncbi:MAG: patatin-like phospholipase family protein [Alcanivoracaceae bacterium]|nr:patatin-like phospholipase family protein [Alcanivoracaceae bacterium]